MTRLTRALLRTAERSDRRSPLFWWMVDNHDQMLSAARDRPISWDAFAGEAARLGLTDTKGQPPTPRNARETWIQARRAVAKERERQAAEAAKPRVGAIPPSRIPHDWRPEEVVVGRTQSAALTRAPAPAVPRSGAAGTASPADKRDDRDDAFEKEFQAWLRDHRINIPADASPHLWEQYRKAFAEFSHQDRFLRLSS